MSSNGKIKFKDLNSVVGNTKSQTVSRVEMNRMMSKVNEMKRMIKKSDTAFHRESTAKEIVLSSGLNSRNTGKQNADKISSDIPMHTILAL